MTGTGSWYYIFTRTPSTRVIIVLVAIPHEVELERYLEYKYIQGTCSKLLLLLPLRSTLLRFSTSSKPSICRMTDD
jgi:hypothetical protein